MSKIRKIPIFEKFISINENEQELQAQKQAIALQMQQLQQRSLELDQQILNAQKAALAKGPQGADGQPAQPGVNEDLETGSADGPIKPKSEVLQIEDVIIDDNIVIIYKLTGEQDPEDFEVPKEKFFAWYKEYAERHYGDEYVNGYKSREDGEGDEDGYPTSSTGIDYERMLNDEDYSELKKIARKYLLFAIKNEPND